MSLIKTIINPANRGGQKLLCHTLKANYFKMAARNFLFTKAGDGFDATGVILEYV